MSQQNNINQTHLIIAAITASFAKALEKHNPGFKDDLLVELKEEYQGIREMELPHIETLETIQWTKELIESK